MGKIEFEIVRHRESKTVMELRTFFFKYHTQIEPRNIKKGVPPNTLVLNPEQLIDPHDPFSINIWYAIYCRGYYVTVEQSRTAPIFGPHVAKLYYQVYPGGPGKCGRFEWIGTATFKCNFFSVKEIGIRLRRAIRLREYFVGESVEDIVIELGEPAEDTVAELD